MGKHGLRLRQILNVFDYGGSNPAKPRTKVSWRRRIFLSIVTQYFLKSLIYEKPI